MKLLDKKNIFFYYFIIKYLLNNLYGIYIFIVFLILNVFRPVDKKEYKELNLILHFL